MRKAKSALVRLTLSFPKKSITSPITFTFPIRSMLLMINSVAISEALKNPFPVIAICEDKPKIYHYLISADNRQNMISDNKLSSTEEVAFSGEKKNYFTGETVLKNLNLPLYKHSG